jgi:hypothetical protein
MKGALSDLLGKFLFLADDSPGEAVCPQRGNPDSTRFHPQPAEFLALGTFPK